MTCSIIDSLEGVKIDEDDANTLMVFICSLQGLLELFNKIIPAR